MSKYENHTFVPEGNGDWAAPIWCSRCMSEIEDKYLLTSYIPEMVLGEHSYEVFISQCPRCEHLTVMVIDEIDPS